MPSRRTNNFPESGRGLGHVTHTTFGSTVGYRSDSLASCSWFYQLYNSHVRLLHVNKRHTYIHTYIHKSGSAHSHISRINVSLWFSLTLLVACSRVRQQFIACAEYFHLVSEELERGGEKYNLHSVNITPTTHSLNRHAIWILYALRVILYSLAFYRAMHFSAKRGIAIACRLSVCLSVCL